MSLRERLKALIIDERGAELAEYAVGVALLVAIGIVVYKVLGNSINDSQSGTAARSDNAVPRSGFCSTSVCVVRHEVVADRRPILCSGGALDERTKEILIRRTRGRTRRIRCRDSHPGSGRCHLLQALR